jgi:hypothetical protein
VLPSSIGQYAYARLCQACTAPPVPRYSDRQLRAAQINRNFMLYKGMLSIFSAPCFLTQINLFFFSRANVNHPHTWRYILSSHLYSVLLLISVLCPLTWSSGLVSFTRKCTLSSHTELYFVSLTWKCTLFSHTELYFVSLTWKCTLSSHTEPYFVSLTWKCTLSSHTEL